MLILIGSPCSTDKDCVGDGAWCSLEAGGRYDATREDMGFEDDGIPKALNLVKGVCVCPKGRMGYRCQCRFFKIRNISQNRINEERRLIKYFGS